MRFRSRKMQYDEVQEEAIWYARKKVERRQGSIPHLNDVNRGRRRKMKIKP